MRTRRYAWLGLAAVITLFVALVAGAARAASGGDSASGHVTRPLGNFDFSAKSTSTGTNAHGRASVTFTINDPDQKFAGEVTCLRVVGATPTTPALASIGVRLTQMPPGFPWQSMIIVASDSGKFSGAPDTAEVFLQAVPAPPDGACPAPFTSTLVDAGEVTIQNTLP